MNFMHSFSYPLCNRYFYEGTLSKEEVIDD
nr:MAG TPA: hypothetical protein [Caudoviricetes sp.]